MENGVNVTLVQADEGDFIWVAYGSNKKSHLLIDGGTKETGSYYEDILKQIIEKEEIIEAIILTHIDYDHIQGMLEGIKEIDDKSKLQTSIKKIFLNTCNGIQKRDSCVKTTFGHVEDDIKTTKKREGYGVGEAISFLNLIEEKGLIDRLIDYVDYEEENKLITFESSAVLKVISPGKRELKKLAEDWEKYDKFKAGKGFSTNGEDTSKDLEELKKESLTYDTSTNNKSSIAFLFEYENFKLAFLGDAVPSVCMKGLKAHGITSPYPVDLLKISHHGSRGNTSDKLLKALPTKNYLLSTDGNHKKVPNKVMLAHILKNSSNDENIKLFCNYEWWEDEYHGTYFTKKDCNEVLNRGKLSLEVLGLDGKKIKDGLLVNGYE